MLFMMSSIATGPRAKLVPSLIRKKIRQSFGYLLADLVLSPALWVVRASLSAVPGVVTVVVVVATSSSQCGGLCHANSQSKCSQNHL